MTELSFAKTFLSTLDARPIKLQPDHAADLKTVELKGPYTLPRYPSSPSMQPPSLTTTTPSTTTTTPPATAPPTVTITLKSLRNPPLTLSLPSQPWSTSIFELKARVAHELGRQGTGGIKLLYGRKPAGDAKTVREVVGEEEGDVELGVMVMAEPIGGVEGGGAAAVAQGASGEEVMGSDAFWGDLKAWLMQRVRDEGMAGEVWGLFKRGWDER